MASSNQLAFDRTMTAPAGRLTPRELAATQHTMAFVGDAGAIPTLMTGTTVASRYHIKKRLGRGGMGEVYEAQDVALGENVALKTLRLGLSGVSVDQFRQEAQLARRVTHVNVCRIHDIGHHEGVDFLTMELLEGETLSARLDRVGRLGTDAAHALLAQIVAGVNAAHEAGIVHRDLKCGNIMIVPGTRGERAVITDFGLALQAGTPGSIAGSPAYMAPEQVTGGDVGPAADLYALGVTMFEMVTGKLPFVGDTAEQTARKRLEAPPPSPRTIVPDVDARWDKAIMCCLAREPSERFADASSLLAAVSEPVRRRGPARWVLGGLALAVIAAAGLLGSGVVGRGTPGAGGPAVPAPGLPVPAPAAPMPPPPPPPAPPAVVVGDPAAVVARGQAITDKARALVEAQAGREQQRSEREQQRSEREQEHAQREQERAQEEHDRAEERAQEQRDRAEERADEQADKQEAAGDPDPKAVLAHGVRRVGPGHMQIGVEVLSAVARDTDLLVGSTHMETLSKDGKTIGLQLSHIEPGTLVGRLGFQEGDVITSLGGATVESSDDAREALGKLDGGASLSVGYLRKGKPLTLEVSLAIPGVPR